MTATVEVHRQSWRPVEAWFTSWQPSLLRYAQSLCRTPELAEDLVQEAFLALCRKSVQGEDIRNPRRWTLTVVRHQASRQLRNQRRHCEELQPPEILEALPAVDAPATEGDDKVDISGLLSALTPREKEVFLLRMQSLKYRQIADRLAISPKTVSALLARARHKLQNRKPS